MTLRIEEGNQFVDTVGSNDYGSDESIVSPLLAEKAVLIFIGKMTKIEPISSIEGRRRRAVVYFFKDMDSSAYCTSSPDSFVSPQECDNSRP